MVVDEADASLRRLVEADQPDTLSKLYHGNVSKTSKDGNVTTQPLLLKMVNKAYAQLQLQENTDWHDVAVVIKQHNVWFKDIYGNFEFTGLNDPAKHSIQGKLFMNATEAGSFTMVPGAAPLNPWSFSAEGRRVIMIVSVGGGLIAAMLYVSKKSACPHSRAYLDKVLSSAFTLFIGNLLGQSALGLIFAFPGPAPGYAVQAAVMFALLFAGWASLTLICWKVQMGPLYRMITWMLGADILGFVGVYAFDLLWKYIVATWKYTEGIESFACAFGVLVLSWLIFFLLHKLTDFLRSKHLPEQPEHHWASNSYKRSRPKLGSEPPPEQGCATGGFASWMSCVGPRASEESEVVQAKKPDWKSDVEWGENTVIAIVEAFLAYKIILMCVAGFNTWWETGIAFGVMGALVLGGVLLSKKHEVPKLEHILMQVDAFLAGLAVVNTVRWLLIQTCGMHYLITQMAVAGITFAIVVIAIHFIGHHANKSGHESLGFVHVGHSNPEKDPDRTKHPQEVYFLAIMVAMSLSNVFEVILGLLVSTFAIFRDHPILWKTVFAVLMLIGGVSFWRHHLLPHAGKSIEHHKQAMSREGDAHVRNKLMNDELEDFDTPREFSATS